MIFALTTVLIVIRRVLCIGLSLAESVFVSSVFETVLVYCKCNRVSTFELSVVVVVVV